MFEKLSQDELDFNYTLPFFIQKTMDAPREANKIIMMGMTDN